MSKRVEREQYCGTGVGRHFNIVRTHASEIAELPPPDEEWTITDEHVDIGKPALCALKKRGVVYKTRRGNAADDEPHYWSVDGDAHEYATDLVDTGDRLACCGATGIVNDGGTIKCNRCGEPVPREEAKEVLS